MGDQSQDLKKRATYDQWTEEESKLLLELMVEGARKGWRDNNGIFVKQLVEERILPTLNKKLGVQKTFKNYQSRLKWFKNRWTSYSTLKRFSSGFGYDSTTKKFTVSDEIWEEYFKAHPKDTNLKYMTIGDYEDLEIAVGNGVAVGENSIGSGNATDARTLGDTNVFIEDLQFDSEFEAFVRKDQYFDTTFETALEMESPKEVQMQETMKRKRTRIEYERNHVFNNNVSKGPSIDHLDKISFSIDEMVELLKRKDTGKVPVWDAINEIPDLSENNRFKAMELFEMTSGTMNKVFLKMSPEDRSKWIAHKLGGL